MNDRFYDIKGIEHSSEYAAKWANSRYLEKEEVARKQSLDLQRQQAKATERAAREAYWQRQKHAEEQAGHNKRMLELKASELEEQRTLAQFQKDVAFLEGESDETRINYLLRRSLQDSSS